MSLAKYHVQLAHWHGQKEQNTTVSLCFEERKISEPGEDVFNFRLLSMCSCQSDCTHTWWSDLSKKILKVQAGIFLKILGWVFFGMTFFETQAYCSPCNNLVESMHDSTGQRKEVTKNWGQRRKKKKKKDRQIFKRTDGKTVHAENDFPSFWRTDSTRLAG